MPFEEVFALSSRIQERFISTPEFKASKRIALYAGFRNEALTDDILAAAVKDKKEVFQPVFKPCKVFIEIICCAGKGIFYLSPVSNNVMCEIGYPVKRVFY